MTNVEYNGVLLKNVTTRQCDQSLVYDPTGTDLAGERVSLTFECIVHAQNFANLFLHGAAVNGANPNGQNSDPVSQFHAVRRLLSEPRRELRVFVGSETLWHVYPPLSAGDVVNDPLIDTDAGPKPRDVKIAAIMGEQAFKISWSVDFMYGVCPESDSPAFAVVYNKWSVSEVRDANFFTTRTISGSIRFSSRMYAGHSYLKFCVPGLEYGFKRESIQYESDAGGLEARYSVTDRQVHTAAPWPATHLQGSYSWSTSLESGNWIHHADFTLTGGPDSDVGLLVARAIELCDARIKYLETPLDPGSKLLNEVSITEHVGEANSVRVAMTATIFPEGGVTMMLANIAADQIGQPIELQPLAPYPGAKPEDSVPYDVGESRVPFAYGYVPRQAGARDPTILFLLHCYQQDPCGNKKAIYQWTNGTTSPEERDEATRDDVPMYELPPGTFSPGDLGKFDATKMTKIYTSIRMSSQYRVTKRRSQLSIADDDPTADSGAVISWGRGMARRIVRLEAERQDDWPELPDLTSGVITAGRKHLLLDYCVEPSSPKTSADGLHLIYHVRLWAIYALPEGVADGTQLDVGKLPYLTDRKNLNLGTQTNAGML